jgi:hypothetical protein
MRDLDIIDSELRVLAAVRRTVAELGGPVPSARLVDQLPDERAATAKGRSAPRMTPVTTAIEFGSPNAKAWSRPRTQTVNRLHVLLTHLNRGRSARADRRPCR